MVCVELARESDVSVAFSRVAAVPLRMWQT